MLFGVLIGTVLAVALLLALYAFLGRDSYPPA